MCAKIKLFVCFTLLLPTAKQMPGKITYCQMVCCFVVAKITFLSQMHKEQNAQVSDTTMLNRITKVDNKRINIEWNINLQR